MFDAEEKRRIAGNWREYLRDTRESFRAYAWVWKELISPLGRKWTKRALALVTAQMLVSAAMPMATAYVLDGLVSRRESQVAWAIIAFALCTLIGRLLAWGYGSCQEIVSGENVVHVDLRTSELFFEKSLGQHLRDDGALSAANIEKGRGRVHEISNMLIFEGIPSMIELVVGYVLLFVIAPVAGLAMTAVLLIYLVWMIFLNRKVTVVCTPLDAEFRAINRHRVERWDGIERVKTCGKEREELREMGRRLGATLAKDRRFWLWFIRMTTLRGMANNVGVIVILAYGAWRVWQGDWTVGLLYPLLRWTTQVSDNFWKIGQIEHRLNWGLPSVQSMRAALTLVPDIVNRPDAVVLPDEAVRVELDRVTHAYPAASGAAAAAEVLRRVSFSVAPGEKVALIGESGAGKTTVMRTLLRYSDPSEGAVRVNGIDLRDVDLDAWRRLVAYIPQQAQVFDGTIRANLLYGLPEERRAGVTDDQLWELMRALRIDFGARLTEGLDTIVGRRGIKLSGGQAQRLMIGAAIVKRPRFLIVDEATSSLDSTTEREVQEGIEKVIEASTSALIITHRLPTVRRLCTKFVVLKTVEKLAGDENQVEAAAGSFEELYRISPTFRRLADDQSVSIGGSTQRPSSVKALPAVPF